MIICVGIGPGDMDFITEKARRIIAESDVVSGFEAVINFACDLIPPDATIISLDYANQMDKLKDVAALHREGKTCCVLFMGDIHFSGFQLWQRVEMACGHRVDSVPGISSVQILASRAHIYLDDTTSVSFHRRGQIDHLQRHLVHALKDGRNAVIIPRPWDFMPHDISAHLLAEGIPGEQKCEVWENLTKKEACWKGNLDQVRSDFSDMSIMLVRKTLPDSTL